MIDPKIPVLVGGGQITEKLPPEQAKTPIEMMQVAVERALANAGSNQALLHHVDTIACTRLAIDSTDLPLPGIKGYHNVPRALGKALGQQARHEIYAAAGGNSPQMLVNKMAQRIAEGETGVAILSGSENLNTLINSFKAGQPVKWEDDEAPSPETWGDDRPGVTPHENEHGLFYPINTYPLFENAIRGEKGRTVSEHLHHLAQLFSPFSMVASENPHAWFPTYRSVEDIETVSEKNRYVGFPYTKYLNAVIQVDMAAAVIMMSVEKARELGIDESRWVYLNGCADANDHWEVTSRVNYYSSPAMRKIFEVGAEMACTSIQDIDFFDLYSCFPSAVEIARREFGIDENDPRSLTVTGGLPYFGGPGNNYTMHAIVTMLDKLRNQPGSQGLVNANGWFVTKHSLGIYSTKPIHERWQRTDPSDYQKDIDAMAKPAFTETPEGEGTIETYTVVHQGQKPALGIVIGRLNDGTRFLANTPADTELLERMKQQECLGRAGTVSHKEGKNIFIPRFD